MATNTSNHNNKNKTNKTQPTKQPTASKQQPTTDNQQPKNILNLIVSQCHQKEVAHKRVGNAHP